MRAPVGPQTSGLPSKFHPPNFRFFSVRSDENNEKVVFPFSGIFDVTNTIGYTVIKRVSLGRCPSQPRIHGDDGSY